MHIQSLHIWIFHLNWLIFSWPPPRRPPLHDGRADRSSGEMKSRLKKKVIYRIRGKQLQSPECIYIVTNYRFAEPALRCFYQARPPRKWALQMVMSPWFDRITMAVILINCVTLGMYRPCEDGPDCDTYRCQILDIIDNCIFVYFAIEMVSFKI